jgi:hypothetical protein
VGLQAGGYILGGYTKAYDYFDPVEETDDWDAWLMKLDATGTIVWEKIYGDGGCAETDCTDGLDDDGDGLIDEPKDDVVYSVREVSDGTLAVAGFTYSFDQGGDSDGMILKVSSSGDIGGYTQASGSCVFIEDASSTTGISPSTLNPSAAFVGDSPAVPADTTTTAASTPVDIGYRCFIYPFEVSSPSSATPFLFLNPTSMSWEEGSLSNSDTFNLYRGDVTDLPSGDYGMCLQPDLLLNGTTDPAVPPSGTTWFYLVSGENIEGEGPLGNDSDGFPRISGTTCP